MKRITLLVNIFVLLGALVLSACGAKTAEPTMAVNIPVVANDNPTAVPTSGVPSEPAVTETAAYPIEQQPAAVPTYSPAVTYPVESALPQTDEEWRAFITEKLQGHHTLDFLLSQNLSEQQWQETLAKRYHADVSLTDEEKAAMIQWLMAH